MKETAVDYLFQKLWTFPRDKWIWQHYLEKAKQMQKEQIEEAHLNGQSEWDINALGEIQKKLSEQYYQETYGKNA